MATVTGFTAERMLEIENTTVVDGEVQGDNLILLTREGTPIDAGSVRGPKGDTGAVGPASVHPGIISMYGGNSAPAGYLLCDGSAVSRTTYADLFAEIATNYGVGDGANTFNLPNLQQKFPVGKGTEAWADTLNDSGGSKDAVVVQHNHNIGHTHNASNHQHGFDHGHGASAGNQTKNHLHGQPAHMHPGTGGTGGVGYPYREIVAAGAGDGSDVYNPGGNNTRIWWEVNPASSYAGGENTGYENDVHSHVITVAATSGATTTPAGAQALTHTGNTPDLPAPAVVGTDKNLPPYVVVNFIIKT